MRAGVSFVVVSFFASAFVWAAEPQSAVPRPQSPASSEEVMTINRSQASLFARMAIGAITREYPNKPDHYLSTAANVKGPRALHPAFFGALDWHSSVHGHWTLVRLLRWFPDLPEQKQVRAILGEHLTAKNIQIEADYFTQPGRQTFERMYGWAWLLKLDQEVRDWDDPDGRQWAKNLEPLARTDRGPVPRLPAQADVSHPHRAALEHGVWAFVRSRLRPGRRQQAAGEV